jgi:Flp pilus assembly protein TadG
VGGVELELVQRHDPQPVIEGSEMTRGQDSERGAVLVLTALTMVTLLVMAALVVDYGNSRQKRRQGQGSADASALVAVQAVYSNGTATANWTGTSPPGAIPQVKSYAYVNYGVDTSATGPWATCTDTGASDYWSSVGVISWTWADTALSGNHCISTDSLTAPTLIRVAMPVNNVSTVFGKAAGVTQTAVRSSAVAQVTLGLTVPKPGVVALDKSSGCVDIDLSGSVAAKVQTNNGNVVVNCPSDPPVTFHGSNATINAVPGTFYSVGQCQTVNLCTNGGTVTNGVIRMPQYAPDPLAAVPPLSPSNPAVVYNGSAGGISTALGSGNCLQNKAGYTYGYYYITSGNLDFYNVCAGAHVMLYLAGTSYMDQNLNSEITMFDIDGTHQGQSAPLATDVPPASPAGTLNPYAGISIFMERHDDNSSNTLGRVLSMNGNSNGTVSSGTIYAKDGVFGRRGNSTAGNIDWLVQGQVVVASILMSGGGGPKNGGLVVNVPASTIDLELPAQTSLVR